MARFCRQHNRLLYLGLFKMKKCTHGICNGSGFILVEATESSDEYFTLCQCRLEANSKVDLNSKLIGAYFPIKLTIYSPDEYLSIAKMPSVMSPDAYAHNVESLKGLQAMINDSKFFMSGPDSIWVSGASQSGKTSLALALGKSLLLNNISVRYISLPKLAEMFKDFDNLTDNVKELNRFKVYIIDDIFDPMTDGKLTKYVYQELYSFIKSSLMDGKKFIFVSPKSFHNMAYIYKDPFKNTEIFNSADLQYLLVSSFREIALQGHLGKYLINKSK